MLRFFVLGGLVVLGALTVMAAVIGGPGWWVWLAVIVALAGCRGPRPGAEEALDPAQLPGARPPAVPARGHPSRAAAVLHRAQLRRSPLRPGHPLVDLPRAKGENEEQPFGTERDVNAVGLRVPRPLHRAGRDAEGAAPGPDRRAGLHPALRHGAAQRLGDELRRAQRPTRSRRSTAAPPRAGSPTTRGRAGSAPTTAGRRPGLGARLAATSAPATQGRRVRRARVRRQGGRRPGQDGQPQAQPGRQARHRRGAARGQGDPGDRRGPRRPAGREVHVAVVPPGVLHAARAGAVRRPRCASWPAASRPASSSASARGPTSSAICKAMVEEGITPDFIVVDGAEGGTGAAPLEYEDHIGTPLTEGLMTVHNALVGVGLRDRVKVGASGKVATGIDIVKRHRAGRRLHQRGPRDDDGGRLHPGADLPHQHLPGRGRDPGPEADARARRARQDRAGGALPGGGGRPGDAGDGLDGAAPARDELRPHMLRRRIDHSRTESYAELFEHLASGELLRRAAGDLAAGLGTGRPRRLPPVSDRPERNPMTTVAELLVEALAEHGVRTVWGVVGDALNPVTDAIRREERIEWVGVRHEEAGAFAAGAQAQLTGRLGVCMGTVGPGRGPPAQRAVRRQEVARPGARDLRAGAARGDRQRLLPGGRQRRGVRRRGGVQPHRDHASTRSRRSSSRRSTPRWPSRASRCCRSPGTSAGSTCPRAHARCRASSTGRRHAAPSAEALHAAAARHQRRRQRSPCWSARAPGTPASEVLQLAERLAAPMVLTLKAKEGFEDDNDFEVGQSGLIGNHATKQRLRRLRRAGDARHRLPLQGVPAQRARRSSSSTSAARTSAGARPSTTRSSATPGCGLQELLPLLEAKPDRRHLEKARSSYRRGASGSSTSPTPATTASRRGCCAARSTTPTPGSAPSCSPRPSSGTPTPTRCSPPTPGWRRSGCRGSCG